MKLSLICTNPSIECFVIQALLLQSFCPSNALPMITSKIKNTVRATKAAAEFFVWLVSVGVIKLRGQTSMMNSSRQSSSFILKSTRSTDG